MSLLDRLLNLGLDPNDPGSKDTMITRWFLWWLLVVPGAVLGLVIWVMRR